MSSTFTIELTQWQLDRLIERQAEHIRHLEEALIRARSAELPDPELIRIRYDHLQDQKKILVELMTQAN